MWLLWDTEKDRHLFDATKGQRWPLPVLYPGHLACQWVELTTDMTLPKPESTKRTVHIPYLSNTSRTTNMLKMSRSGAEAINRCGLVSLCTGTAHIYTYANTLKQTHCTTMASSVHTIHPPQWPGTAYTMLEHIFTPQQFTLGLWQLIVYATVGLQGHHSLSVCPSDCLPVCPSVSVHLSVLPVRTMAKGLGGDGDWTMMTMMLDHSLKGQKSKVFWGHSSSWHLFMFMFCMWICLARFTLMLLQFVCYVPKFHLFFF